MAAKKAMCLRLSETTIKELGDLAKRYSASQSDVVSVLVHCVYANGEIGEDSLDEWFDVIRLG